MQRGLQAFLAICVVDASGAVKWFAEAQHLGQFAWLADFGCA